MLLHRFRDQSLAVRTIMYVYGWLQKYEKIRNSIVESWFFILMVMQITQILQIFLDEHEWSHTEITEITEKDEHG